MVSTKMSPERPLLGTMSATSAFLSAGSPARSWPMTFTRRPAPMRRGIGIGGSTTPFLAWPSGPISLWRTVSTPKKENQCGGSSLPRENFSGSRLKAPAARRTAISPTSSSTVRTRPIQGRRSFIASSIQLIASSSVARKIARIAAKKKGLLSQALSTDRKTSGTRFCPDSQQRLEALPAPVDPVISDQPVFDVHRFEQVDLRAAGCQPRILPGEKPAVGEEEAAAIELAELGLEVREVAGEQFFDLAAAAQDAVVAVRELRQDGGALEHGVLGIEGHQAGQILGH